MEINVEETKAARMSRQTVPSAGYGSSKATGKYGIFQVFVQHHNESCKMYTWN
jgi:hypothetical protein